MQTSENHLQTRLYQTASLRKLEQAAADQPLMERAGLHTAEWAMELLADHPGPVLILVGPGNNGGDALVAAKYLRRQNIETVVVFNSKSDKLPTDAAQAYQQFFAEGGKATTQIPTQTNWRLIIDGLFGIGLNRKPDSVFADLIDQANDLAKQIPCPVLAIDCPSGLDADTGRIVGNAICASHTLTFLANKPGLLTFEGPDHCGIIRLATLGVNCHDADADGQIVTTVAFSDYFQPRKLNSHKGSYGHIVIIGGVHGMFGAPILAGRAALKLGAGRVSIGLPDPGYQHLVIDFGQPELMIDQAKKLLSTEILPDVIVCGPGLGQSQPSLALLEQAAKIDRPLILDADALNWLARDDALVSLIKKRISATLLTPHPAEAARLLAWPISQVQEDRITACQEIARRFKASVALKGCGTIISNPSGQWQINTSGNPALATAGSGDVLSGIISALVAQGWQSHDALVGAVHLHGLAAEAWATQNGGTSGMCASESIEAARHILNQWLSSRYKNRKTARISC